jgi:hypothetical protein
VVILCGMVLGACGWGTAGLVAIGLGVVGLIAGCLNYKTRV